mgnify:CR=1 FL=1
MESAFSGVESGLQLAGILLGALLIGFTARRVEHRNQMLVPLGYFLVLIAGFMLPLAQDIGAAPAVNLLWLIAAALPAMGYLLVLQLVTDGVPRGWHYLVLIVPVLGIPVLIGASWLGPPALCLTATGGCAPPGDALRVYDVVAGAVTLLILMVVIQKRLPEIEDIGLGREKRALILTIIGLTAIVLALDLAVLFGIFGAGRAEIAGALLRLTFFYLVASSVFRVFPGTFELPEPPLPEREVKRLSEQKNLTAEEQQLLKRIDELMSLDKLYQEPGFSRKQLADELGIPEHRLSRVINIGLGQSFTDLINHHRVTEAKQLLRDTTQPVSQIAFDVGFNSLASFNRVFKQVTDVSPTAFRRQGSDDQAAQEATGPATAAAG